MGGALSRACRPSSSHWWNDRCSNQASILRKATWGPRAEIARRIGEVSVRCALGKRHSHVGIVHDGLTLAIVSRHPGKFAIQSPGGTRSRHRHATPGTTRDPVLNAFRSMAFHWNWWIPPACVRPPRS
jgi:hypothetical protein